MMNVNLKPIGTIVKHASKLMAIGAVALLCSVKPKTNIYGYNDVVDVVMDSDMWSSDKRKVMSILKRDGDEKYYRAVVSIIDERSIWSSDKVNMITELSKN